MNYFELLALPVSLYVDQHKLERNFQNLQRLVHPDRFASKSAEEQRVAMARSAAANEAYQTLRDPMARSRYVLAMRGIDLDECPLKDPELLMEIMEERESLEAIKESPDADKVVQEALKRYQSVIDESLRSAEDLLQSHGDDALTPVTHFIIRVQYYNKLLGDARSLLEKMELRKKAT